MLMYQLLRKFFSYLTYVKMLQIIDFAHFFFQNFTAAALLKGHNYDKHEWI